MYSILPQIFAEEADAARNEKHNAADKGDDEPAGEERRTEAAPCCPPLGQLFGGENGEYKRGTGKSSSENGHDSAEYYSEASASFDDGRCGKYAAFGCIAACFVHFVEQEIVSGD